MSSTQIPPVDPANPNDVTSFLASQASWSETALPDILGRLDPPVGWWTAPKPQQLVEAGRKVFRDNTAILDYDIPRYIASPGKLESWRIEAWFRTHRSLSYDDIWARQPSWVPKPTIAQKKASNYERLRVVRKAMIARTWALNSRIQGVTKVMVETVERLTPDQIEQNTTWTVMLGGIQHPTDPGRVLPLGTFQTNGQTHIPSTEVSNACLELERLQVIARTHGRDHWSELPNTLMAWHRRVNPRIIPTLVPIPGQNAPVPYRAYVSPYPPIYVSPYPPII